MAALACIGEGLRLFAVVGGGLQWFTQPLQTREAPTTANNRKPHHAMPNPWTGIGNPYTKQEVVDRLKATLAKGEPIIAAGAGTGISAKFIEKGGADLIIIYNSGRFRMMGHGSTCGLMAYGDANAIAMEIGEYEVLPVVKEIPVICGVHATDPRRRMWHWLGKVKEMGFSGVNNFPTHTIVDGHFRGVLEETGMSVEKEFEMVGLATRMDLFSIVYVATPEEAIKMAQNGADAIIAHVGTTVGGSIGVVNAVVRLGSHGQSDAGHHRCREKREPERLHPHPRRTDQHAEGRRNTSSARPRRTVSSVPAAWSAWAWRTR
jgi:predicted TIM-barrel enzyme